MHRSTQILLVITTASACGGASPPPPQQGGSAAAADPQVAPAVTREAPSGAGRISRQDLLEVLDGGLGRFLGGVETEPALEDGRFVGFRLRALFAGDARVAAIDLHPGDVVTRINGQPIERPEQALRVWNGLRVASELLIEYQRDGEPRELRFQIVD